MTRVVVTGVGAVSACGIGADALWQAARDGKSCVRETLFPAIPKQRVKQAASLSEENWAFILKDANVRFQDRVTVLALQAAKEAVENAKLKAEDFGNKCGVFIGSGLGGSATLDSNYRLFFKDPSARLDGMSVPKIMANASASWVAMEYGVTGPTYCISTACSSASQSLGLAAQMIRSGAIDRCLAGGSEACLVPGAFRAWELMRVMTPTVCRPFSRDRNGMVLGDGAGILVLESYEAAMKRGAPIIAELAGYGTTSDAADLLRPDPAGATASMNMALAEAGLQPDEIGYVNAHGTGTVANDVVETEALRQVFGNDLVSPLISSTKPIHGHALGATGALEAIVSIYALRAQAAPPTINFNDIDPKIGIDPVANSAMPFSSRACMSNSLAFGGINASLVFSLPENL